VTRLYYFALAGMLALVPLAVVWANEAGPATTSSGSSRSGYYHSHSSFFYSGGRGSWIGNSYGVGHGSYNTGGSSGYRGGGPGGGGK
jgi:hypothetical protein